MPLFNFVSYVFLLLCLCIIIAIYVLFWVFRFTVLLYVGMYCLCVNVYCSTATRCQPNCSEQNIAISKYQTSSALCP